MRIRTRTINALESKYNPLHILLSIQNNPQSAGMILRNNRSHPSTLESLSQFGVIVMVMDIDRCFRYDFLLKLLVIYSFVQTFGLIYYLCWENYYYYYRRFFI